MLTHQARFQPWIPFYKSYFRQFEPSEYAFYRTEFSDDFPIHVADKLYLKRL